MDERPSVPAPPTDEEIPYSAEVLRKGLHLLALVVPLGMAVLGKSLALTLLTPLALLALTADVLRVRSPAFAAFIGRFFGFMMREEERPPVGGPVAINGATWVLLTAAVLTLFFPVRLGASAFAMFMISDAAAALVGRRFGRHRWPGSRRTLEGSLAFFVTALFTFALLPGIVFWTGAVSAFFGTLVEVPTRPLNDNVRVPIVSALTLFLLERFVLSLEVSLFFG